ncbi:MAG: hypothetical protein ACRBN8_34180 [Nannocystales bacterium]
MEWMFVGLSDVLPRCDEEPKWEVLDKPLEEIASRGHQAILRPFIFGDYGDENYAPSDLLTRKLRHDGKKFKNPRWDDERVQKCVLKFIDAFADEYKDNKQVAYIQMGLVGLWGEHHLDKATYTSKNFPSAAFQKRMIEHYLDGFTIDKEAGRSSSDLMVSLSFDSAQPHGLFGSTETPSLSDRRFSFFDDTLLVEGHSNRDNWRQTAQAKGQFNLHVKHGWGGEPTWTGKRKSPCNKDGAWTVPPHDCGNGEPLSKQAKRLGLNYMVASDAFSTDIPQNDLLALARVMGYKFTATAVSRKGDEKIAVTVKNTGVAYCPYKVSVCSTESICVGDLSTLAPGDSVVVDVPASSSPSQVLSLASPRLGPNQKIRWSNASADGGAATLTVTVD